ncbi:hypothetical protein NEMBOFW57_002698 [Staphylotrichum longicolle]|uniref:Mitochondrial carrier protein n=1 Tax=Staphylotrichum longicolle TaxID=669026 RepID=A0AAD4F3J0_9PEZI|nr:hypothetical protein NEMBOFW57_002698 [Staphylotrichum longicolle]
MQKMLSATSGSLLTATPLDVVRVRLQAQGVSKPPQIDFTKLALPTTAADGAAFRPSSLGVTACCREVFFTNNASEVCVVGPRPTATATTTAPPITCAIARNEGVTTLWRGLSPTLLMAIPANIIYFTGYEWLRLTRPRPSPGSAARVLAATAVSPIELFRTRLQAVQGGGGGGGGRSSSNPLADTFRGVTDMVAAHGYRSLWRGLTLTLWRDVPFSGMYWWGYETIRVGWRTRGTGAAGARRGRGAREAAEQEPQPGKHRDTFTDSFIAGAASGGFASVVTMPFDVGKTRTQVFRDAPGATAATTTAAAAAAPEESNMARLLWHIFRTEGVPGLFRGWIPRTLRVAPACAIMISSYEVGKRVFRGVNERALAEAAQAREREP